LATHTSAAGESGSQVHLIVVAGHAVYAGGGEPHPDDDAHWRLQPFQRGEPRFYLEHVRAGVELAAHTPGSLLVFSGGQSRREAGPRSEAEGYRRLADRFGWWSQREVALRTATEEFARDSFENLLFGICRFREHAGRYPETVSVVSWGFKAARFDQHRETLRWPATRFTFAGVNQPIDLAAAQAGELDAIEAFRRDPYGTGGDLAAKRAQRNPFDRQPPYEETCPELAGLLRHRGPDPFEGRLPW